MTRDVPPHVPVTLKNLSGENAHLSVNSKKPITTPINQFTLPLPLSAFLFVHPPNYSPHQCTPKMDLILLEKTLLGLFVAVIFAIAISKLRNKKFKLLPGPIPVPVFGNWLQVGDDLNQRNLSDLAKKFGDCFLLRMGQRNLVVVSSSELAKEVLHTQAVEFGSRS